MSKKVILINVLLFVIIISRFEKSYEECVCNVRLSGEYCGTELNSRNQNSDCQSNHMYFCGDNNEGRTAKILVKCKDEYECEQNQRVLTNRARRRNPCRKRFRCQCPANIGRGPHCGSKMIGDDCPPDMLFICRRRSGIDARDVCPDGCNAGKCIVGVGEDTRDQRGRDDDRTDDDDDSDTDMP